ncbi:MAG: hypothetical protein ACYCV4_19230, partial [Dermatophilaceae bacterium]
RRSGRDSALRRAWPDPRYLQICRTPAEPEELDPDRVWFIRSIRVIRRQVTDQAAFPPERLAAAIIDGDRRDAAEAEQGPVAGQPRG